MRAPIYCCIYHADVIELEYLISTSTGFEMIGPPNNKTSQCFGATFVPFDLDSGKRMFDPSKATDISVQQHDIGTELIQRDDPVSVPFKRCIMGKRYLAKVKLPQVTVRLLPSLLGSGCSVSVSLGTSWKF